MKFFIETINGCRNYWEKLLDINDNRVSFKLDSGADLNVLPFYMLSMLGIHNKEIHYCGMQIMAFGGFVLNVKEKVRTKCEINGTKEEVEFMVINKNIKPI